MLDSRPEDQKGSPMQSSRFLPRPASPTRRAVRGSAGAAILAAALVLTAPARAQSTAPQAADEALRHGNALVQAGRFADAIPELERADQLAGARSAAIRVVLARAYAGAGAHAEARDLALAALSLEPAGTTADEARVLLCQNRPEPAGDATEGEAPRQVGGAVARPEILYRVNPKYPPDLRKAHATGTVIVDAIIDEEGCVSAAHVLRGAAPGFDAAALEAVMQWVFRPATADGQPVKVLYTLTTNFAIDTTPPRAPGAEREPG
jgi:TonB family protein